MRLTDKTELILSHTQATPLDVPGGFLDEELTLDTVNLDNVLPVRLNQIDILKYQKHLLHKI